jgi:hypothetical protein
MIGIVLTAAALAGPAYDVLKLRDGADCAALGTSPAVRDELLTLAEGDIAPSYVPIRAAGCLIDGFAADPLVVDHARAWVTDPRWLGLGMLVANRVDTFSPQDGLSIAQAIVAVPDPALKARLARRLARSQQVEIQKVAAGLDGVEGGR